MIGLQTGGVAEHLLRGTADTLAAVRDSLASSGGSAYADTLTLLPGMSGVVPVARDTVSFADSVPVVDTLAVTAQQMFGEHSVAILADRIAGPAPVPMLTDSIVFNVVALVCFAVYCFMVYFYGQQVLTVVSVFRSKLYVDNLLGEHNYTFDNFLNIAVSLGVLTVSMAVVKVADLYVGDGTDVAGAVPGWVTVPLVLWVWCACGAVILYQYVVLRVTAWLTYSQKFITRLSYLRKINFALFAVALVPVLLMFSLAGSGIGVLTVLLCAGLGLVVIFHLVRTYMLFVDEKISKLYWFLYLCGVEIFPVTLLLFSVVKYLL